MESNYATSDSGNGYLWTVIGYVYTSTLSLGSSVLIRARVLGFCKM